MPAKKARIWRSGSREGGGGRGRREQRGSGGGLDGNPSNSSEVRELPQYRICLPAGTSITTNLATDYITIKPPAGSKLGVHLGGALPAGSLGSDSGGYFLHPAPGRHVLSLPADLKPPAGATLVVAGITTFGGTVLPGGAILSVPDPPPPPPADSSMDPAMRLRVDGWTVPRGGLIVPPGGMTTGDGPTLLGPDGVTVPADVILNAATLLPDHLHVKTATPDDGFYNPFGNHIQAKYIYQIFRPDEILPVGFTLPAGTKLPGLLVLPARNIIPEGMHFPCGTAFPARTVIPSLSLLAFDSFLYQDRAYDRR